jgi:hypothetical protein
MVALLVAIGIITFANFGILIMVWGQIEEVETDIESICVVLEGLVNVEVEKMVERGDAQRVGDKKKSRRKK